MTSDEQRVKHLEWIQSIVSRQAANSFLLKGWSITLVAGLFALTDKSHDRSFLWLAWWPVVAFGFLDVFYLHKEKRYIALYNWVQRGQMTEAQIRQHGPFALNPDALVSDLPSYGKALGSFAIWGFYGPLLAASLLVPLWLSSKGTSEDDTSPNRASATTPVATSRESLKSPTRASTPKPARSSRPIVKP